MYNKYFAPRYFNKYFQKTGTEVETAAPASGGVPYKKIPRETVVFVQPAPHVEVNEEVTETSVMSQEEAELLLKSVQVEKAILSETIKKSKELLTTVEQEQALKEQERLYQLKTEEEEFIITLLLLL